MNKMSAKVNGARQRPGEGQAIATGNGGGGFLRRRSLRSFVLRRRGSEYSTSASEHDVIERGYGTVSTSPSRSSSVSEPMPLLAGVCVLLLGLCVNTMWVWAQIAAQEVASFFHNDANMPMLVMCSQVFCGVGAACNAVWFSSWKMYSRAAITYAAFLMGGALLLCALWTLDGNFGFGVMLAGCCFLGYQYFLWELLGFSLLRLFPGSAVGYWGTGTGITGLLLSPVFMWFTAMEVSLAMGAFVLIMFQGVVVAASLAYLLHVKKGEEDAEPEERRSIVEIRRQTRRDQAHAERWSRFGSVVEVEQSRFSSVVEIEDKVDFDLVLLKQLLRFGSPTSQLLTNMFVANFASQALQIGVLQLLTLKPINDGWLAQNAFATCLLCASIGQFAGRASVAAFQIYSLAGIWACTLSQVAAMAIWLFEAATGYLRGAFGNTALLILMGHLFINACLYGICYSHILNCLLKRSDIESRFREPAVSMNYVANCSGVILATLLSLFITNCFEPM